MNPNVLRQLLVLALCMAAAVLLGTILATGNMEFLFLLTYAVVGVFMLTAPGFIPLLVFGLVAPFSLPIPFIHNFPFLLLILGLCLVKLFFYKAIAGHRLGPYRSCVTIGFFLFFLWVGVRYCINPALPNIGGFGANVTGFRAYLNYGLCFLLLAMLPLFISDLKDMVCLMRWFNRLSLIFLVLLTPLIFTKSVEIATWLTRFGMFVTFFDNGWLRFVALQGLGLVLLSLALLPNFMPMSTRKRLLLGFVALVSIPLCGNRTTLAMAIIMALTIIVLQRKWLLVWLASIGIALLLVAAYFIGEHIDLRGKNAGVLRVLAISSPRIAHYTDAAGTAIWRKQIWDRAIDEIKTKPFIGKGYGGLDNAWMLAETSWYEVRNEVSLVSGGVHNGFLASAYALGIPAVVIFSVVFLLELIRNARHAWKWWGKDPALNELFAFICANLTAFLFWIYVGTDLNMPIIWLYLGLGVIARHIAQRQQPFPVSEFSRPALSKPLVPQLSAR